MIKQLSLDLFNEPTWCDVGAKILDILNSADTQWKNSLIISLEKYEKWTHVPDKFKTYSFVVKDTKNEEKRHFTYYDWDISETEKLNLVMYEKIGNILKDDIYMALSPTLIHIHFRECEKLEPRKVLDLL